MQQKAFHILNAVIYRTHRVYSITNTVSKFVKVEFAETDLYLGKMRQTYWVMTTKDRFCKGGQLLIKVFLKNAYRRLSFYFGVKLIPFRDPFSVKVTVDL